MAEKVKPSDVTISTISISNLSDFNSKTHLAEKGQFGQFDDNEYNPFDHRPQENSNSTGGSLAHLLKSSLGAGILAMPMAFKNAGLLFGAVGTIVVGLLCTHCVHILVKTSHEICRQIKTPSLGFSETAEKVFEYGPKPLQRWSNFAKQFVDGALMATYYAASCVYILFIARSFQEVINYDLEIRWRIEFYIAMTLIPILILGQIRNLRYLIPFSAMANVFIVVTFAITLYYMFNKELELADKPLFASWGQLPQFFSTVIFAMEGIGVVMPVENSMKKPQHFLGCPGVLNTAMAVVVLLYGTIGFFGYVRYGDDIKGSITLNLQQGEPLADAGKILMALAILFTYSLQFYVPMDILWRKIKDRIPESKHNVSQIALRSGIILVTGSICAAAPQLDPFIGLVGAVFFSVLGILIPSIVQTIFLWPNRLGTFKWMLWKNMILAAFALLALVTGSIVSIEEIITKLGSEQEK